MTTAPSDTAEAAYRDPAAASTSGSPTCSARMTVEEKVAQLGQRVGLPARRRPAACARSSAAELLADGARSGHAHLRRQRPDRRRGGPAGQRHPAVPGRADPAGHPGHRARGDLLGSDGPGRDGLPAGDRGRQHVAARAGPGDGRRGAAADAGDAAPTRACPRCWTSAATRAGVGPRRRSARTRTWWPAWASAFVRGLQGDDLRAGRDGDREALRRVRRLGGWHELGAGPHRRPRAARGVPAPVRGGGPHGRAPLGDERLQRARRRALRGRPRAADRDPARRVGVRRLSWSPTTSRCASWSPTTTSTDDAGRRPRWRCGPGSTSSCPSTDCYGAPLLEALRAAG